MDIMMPQLGSDMTNGKLLRWLKREGEHVDAGEPIAEVETDKVNVEVEATAAGILESFAVTEGETAPVGSRIAVLRQEPR